MRSDDKTVCMVVQYGGNLSVLRDFSPFPCIGMAGTMDNSKNCNGVFMDSIENAKREPFDIKFPRAFI
jgi:hypothetical protein